MKMKNLLLTAIILFLTLTTTCTENAKEGVFLLCNQLADLPIRKVIGFGTQGIGIVTKNEIRFFSFN